MILVKQQFCFFLSEIIMKPGNLFTKCVEIGKKVKKAKTLDDLNEIMTLLSDFPSHIETGPIGVGSIKANDFDNIAELVCGLECKAMQLSLFPELQIQLNGLNNSMKKPLHVIINDTAEHYGEDHEHYNDLLAFAAILMKVESHNGHKTVLLLGNSGVGKSLLGNIIINDPDRFALAKKDEPCTNAVEVAMDNARKVSVIDTPGLIDSRSWRKAQTVTQQDQEYTIQGMESGQ